ncbi:MAG: VCBS repeat-containing protein [Balneolaceae bacterium]|nr:VCBS repeat-containing protein [Balneolaceae bacterium]
MRFLHILILLVLSVVFSSCWIEAAEDSPNGPGEPDPIPYENVSSSNIPTGSLSGTSNKALAVDIEQDGDLDLVIASQGPNKILLNNGSGEFSLLTNSILDRFNYNSQDVAVADFNGDGRFDLFFGNAANQSNQQINEFYINQGNVSFSNDIGLIPVSGISNSAIARDLNRDGFLDILIGNSGQNVLLINNGNARFFNETGQRLPSRFDLTRDIEVGDISGNGFPDIIVANENDDNRILANNGSGIFLDQTGSRLPLISAIEETREVELADVDGDGDLDIYYSNVRILESGADPQDRLLLNNGQGVFSDATSQLPSKTTNTFDTDFVDIDFDGDLDIVTGNFNGGMQIFLNNGNGIFSDDTENWLPEDLVPRVVEFEIADYNGDQLPDIYIAVFDGPDVLLLRKELQE